MTCRGWLPAADVAACDQCPNPMIGGALGGGTPPERWCADHAPDLNEPTFSSHGEAPAEGDRERLAEVLYEAKRVAYPGMEPWGRVELFGEPWERGERIWAYRLADALIAAAGATR